MIKDVRKNQMKSGQMMSTRNIKLLLIHGIVFLLFLIVQNLFLNLDHFTLEFAVKSKVVREKFQIKVEKSSKSQYQVICMQENYHWRLYSSLIKGT
uniref:Uncharacterized protein n=1 Tax=Lactuca sativa TaxID=4236 RepID=A0A9R1X4F4_LACSA|nr:hypothetical protein LSAT_V11C700343830 [Lactuca sativa]